MVRRISEITVTLDFIFRLVLCRLEDVLFNIICLNELEDIKPFYLLICFKKTRLETPFKGDNVKSIWSRGHISNFEFCCTLRKKQTVGCFFQSKACLGALETDNLLSFLWSILCKWPVINVTPQTLKIAVHKKQN